MDRTAAILAGETQYDGQACPRHPGYTRRTVSSRACLLCSRDKQKKYYSENGDVLRQKDKERYLADVERLRKKSRDYQRSHKEQHAAYSKTYREKNPHKTVEWIEMRKKRMRADPRKQMVMAAKQRAKKIGVPFDLNWSDLTVPEFCPVLGMVMRVATGERTFDPASPSLDRLKPELGYVRTNVRVISLRANILKRDGTVDELEKVLAYMRAA